MFTFFCAVILAHTEPDSTGATVLMFAFVCAIPPAQTKPARLAIALVPLALLQDAMQRGLLCL